MRFLMLYVGGFKSVGVFILIVMFLESLICF